MLGIVSVLSTSKSLSEASRASRLHKNFEASWSTVQDRKGSFFVLWVFEEVVSPTQILSWVGPHLRLVPKCIPDPDVGA